MPPKMLYQKWVNIGFTHKQYKVLSKHGVETQSTHAESVRMLLDSALSSDVVVEHSEMKELLYLIKKGLTAGNQESVLKRVDKILGGY